MPTMTEAQQYVGAAFFDRELHETDERIAALLSAEARRMEGQIELIAPKNYMSRAVYQAHSSITALTSVEGYPGRRMHAGMRNLDEVEILALERAGALFGCAYANVQPHSGTQANQAVYFSVLETGDPVVSMALKAGGHLSHGLTSNQSGRWFPTYDYGVREQDGLIDYDEAERVVRKVKPKLLIVGGSSYPRRLDFARFREIADTVGALLLADVAHISALVATGEHPSPFPYAHFVTTTTNKNLRGPRGGMILCDDLTLAKAIDRAVFPGVQGGPLPELITAKAVALGEALEPEFKEYAARILENSTALAAALASRGFSVVTGGTETPLVVIDLRPQRLTGDIAERRLESVGLPCNRNLIPGDLLKPSVTSGLRFGVSAVTTRGLGPAELTRIGHLIADALDGARTGSNEALASVSEEVRELAASFPIYRMHAEAGA